MRALACIKVFAVVGLVLFCLVPDGFGTVRGLEPSGSLSIDADTAGNAAGSLGPIDRSVEKPVGESFDVDVVIENASDLLGFGFDLTYDPSAVHVTGVRVNMFLASEAGSNVVDFTKEFAAPEDDDGLITPAAADFAQGSASASTGEGVLARITLLAVTCGTSPLAVKENPALGPLLQDASGELVSPDAIRGAQIRVVAADDAPCAPVAGEAPPPSRTPSAGLPPDDRGGGEDDAAVEGSGEARPDAGDSAVLSNQSEPVEGDQEPLETGENNGTPSDQAEPEDKPSDASDDGSEGTMSRLTPGPGLTDSPEVSAESNGHHNWPRYLVIAVSVAAVVLLLIVVPRTLPKRTR